MECSWNVAAESGIFGMRWWNVMVFNGESRPAVCWCQMTQWSVVKLPKGGVWTKILVMQRGAADLLPEGEHLLPEGEHINIFMWLSPACPFIFHSWEMRCESTQELMWDSEAADLQLYWWKILQVEGCSCSSDWSSIHLSAHKGFEEFL